MKLPSVTVAPGRYGTLRVFSGDHTIGASVSKYGEWAQLEIELLLAFLRPGDTALDIGANIGTHTLAFALRVGPSGSVVSFEPQQVVFDLLELNVRDAGLQQVELHRKAIGAGPGRLSVPRVDYDRGTNVGAIALSELDAARSSWDEVEVVEIDTLGLDRCDLVKIDVEGMEAAALRGMSQTIGKFQPVVQVECNSTDSGIGAIQAIDWSGYATYLTQVSPFNPDNYNGSSDNLFGWAMETNLLFVPESRLRDLPASSRLASVVPVPDFETLAQTLLETPRWGDATPYDRVSPRRLAQPQRTKHDPGAPEVSGAAGTKEDGTVRRGFDYSGWDAAADTPGLTDLILEVRDETVRQIQVPAEANLRTERRVRIYERSLGLAVVPVLVRRGFIRWRERSRRGRFT